MKNIKELVDVDVYLGDGLYARFDGYQIVLYAERDDVRHWVALDLHVLEAFDRYAQELKEAHDRHMEIRP